jgi:cobalt/nickel transport protein
MPQPLSITVVLTSLACVATSADAHYHMLLPGAASAKRGDTISFLYQWGHPFEHQLFDASAPRSVSIFGPDGKKTDLTTSVEKTTVPNADGNSVAAWRFRLKPEVRGDYLVTVLTEPVWMEEEQEFWQDTVKVVLHVQAQKGWDAAGDSGFEIVPLTRPYGLQPGMVFQGVVHGGAKQAANNAGLPVEIERYNSSPPKNLPPDEQITRTVKPDSNQVLTCTLTEPGWWAITAQHGIGKLPRNGKEYPLRRRTTLWVFVDEKTASGADR